MYNINIIAWTKIAIFPNIPHSNYVQQKRLDKPVLEGYMSEKEIVGYIQDYYPITIENGLKKGWCSKVPGES